MRELITICENQTPLGFSISVRVPRNEQMRFLRGQCFAFAISLQKFVKAETGTTMPIWGLFNADGLPEHAFVVDIEKNRAYDSRGELPLDEAAIGAGSSLGAGGKIAPLSMKQIRDVTSVDLSNTKREMPGYVTVFWDDE